MTHSQIIIRDFSPLPVLTSDVLVIACPVMIQNYGLLYYVEGFRHLKEQYPHLKLQFAIPCKDNTGLALKALDAGLKIIYFDQGSPSWPQLQSTTLTYDAQLHDQGELND